MHTESSYSRAAGPSFCVAWSMMGGLVVAGAVPAQCTFIYPSSYRSIAATVADITLFLYDAMILLFMVIIGDVIVGRRGTIFRCLQAVYCN